MCSKKQQTNKQTNKNESSSISLVVISFYGPRTKLKKPDILTYPFALSKFLHLATLLPCCKSMAQKQDTEQ